MPDLYGQLTPQGVLNGSLQTIVYADNYNDLTNKPSINSVELQGNKTAADLGLLTAGDIPVESVNGKQGVVILDGDDIEYEAGTSVNSKITDLEAEIGSGPVISVNGKQGVVELDGTDINYSLTKTLNQKIDDVAASIPVVSYPVTSVNTKTGDVVLDGDDIDYAEGVTVNDQIGTNAAAIGSLSTLTTSHQDNLVSAINELTTYIPVYNNTASGAIATFDTSLALPLQDCTIAINAVQGSGFAGANIYDKGVNLWDEDWEVGGIAWTTGQNSNENDRIRSKNYIPVVPNITVRFSYKADVRYVWCYDQNKTLITNVSGSNNYFQLNVNADTLTLPANCFYIRFIVWTTYGTTYNNNISINYPATDTAYHAYNANSTTTAITWQSEAGTVSEGSLNVTTGKLTVVNGSMGAGDYQITPIPINQLSGTNNIFCDTGNTSVVYACSLKDYIDSQ